MNQQRSLFAACLGALILTEQAMKADGNVRRGAAFSKRLLQTAAVGGAAYACGALLLLSEVLKARPELWTGVLQPEEHSRAPPAAAAAALGNGLAAAAADEDGDEVRHPLPSSALVRVALFHGLGCRAQVALMPGLRCLGTQRRPGRVLD